MSELEDLWDWRRDVLRLYATVRADTNAMAAHAHWSQTRRALFSHHPQSPIEATARHEDPGPFVYPYDPAFRHAVRLAPLADQPEVAMYAGEDGDMTLLPFARTDGLAAPFGDELTLYWIKSYGGGVFLPFRDATNSHETYGAGRYLLDTIKGADLGSDAEGRVILDFNFAYFPSCAYSERYVCPLAPPSNRLPAPICAGERWKAAPAQ